MPLHRQMEKTKLWYINKYFLPSAGLFCSGVGICQLVNGHIPTAILNLGLGAVNLFLAHKYWVRQPDVRS